MVEIQISKSLGWLADVQNHLSRNDLMVNVSGEENLRWLGSMTKQYLTHRGNTEIAVVFGRYIKDIPDLCYQLGRTLPNRLSENDQLEHLIELLTINQTQPQNRFLIWYDADVLYKSNAELMRQIVWTLNYTSQKQGFLKANRSLDINQHNMLIFNAGQGHDLSPLLQRPKGLLPEVNEIKGCQITELRVR